MNKISFIKIKKNLPFYNSDKYIKDLKKNGAKIGQGCVFYKPKTILIDLTSLDFIKIGNYVQLTDGVKILAHDYSYSVVTNKYNINLRPQAETILGNNIFVGMNSIILMGSEIGDNVIIGAGSIVSGKIESNSVYAGNPAKKICSLDEYKEKLENRFEKSALCFYKCKKKSINFNMNIYKCLYTDEKEMKEYIKKVKPIGMKDENIKIIIFKKKYKDLDDFINH